MDIGPFLELVNKGGVIALLAFNLWAFVTGAVVPKWVHTDVRADRDDWRKAAMTSTDNNERLLMLLEERRNEARASHNGNG